MGIYIPAFVVGFVVGWFGMSLVMETADPRLQAQKVAVEQCEQNLPRNQHCKPVVSAKIVKEEY